MEGVSTWKNLLIAGSSGVGKSSLGVTLARGLFPPADAVPARFEGWTITAHPVEFGFKSPGGAYGGQSALKRTTSSSAASSLHLKGAVNLTVWEDWPRKKVEEEEDDDDEDGMDDGDDDEEEEENEEQKENIRRQREEAVNRADAAQTKHVLSNNNNANATASPRIIGGVHRGGRAGAPGNNSNIFANGSNNNNGKNKDDDEPPPPPPCIPNRPILYPKPNVVLLCFSSVSLDSFVEAETVILPDLVDRYPLVPIILVATKCDLKDRDICTTLATPGIIGGSTRSLYATYSSPSSPVVGLIPEGKEVANDNNRQQLLTASRSISNDLNQETAVKTAVKEPAAGSAVPKTSGQLSMCNRSISTDVSLIGSQLSKQTAFRLGLATDNSSKDSDSTAPTSSMDSNESLEQHQQRVIRGQHQHKTAVAAAQAAAEAAAKQQMARRKSKGEGGDDDNDEEGGKRPFMVTSDMGVAMCKRIGASAYIECSAKEQKGLRPILQESIRVVTINPALKATNSLPSPPAAASSSSSGTKKSKKNSAPSFFFGGTRNRVLGMRGSKAVSLNFIRGSK